MMGGDEGAQARRIRQLEETNRRRALGKGSAGQVPPFHVSGVEMLYLICRFDPKRVQQVMPEGLKAAESCWGTLCAYTVPYGWELAPYTAYYMTFEVDGYDSPDGSPAQYMHSGLFSDVGGEVMRSQYNTNFQDGWSRMDVEGPVLTAEAGSNENALVRMSADISEANYRPYTALAPYIGRHPSGGFCRYFVAFTGEVSEVTPLSVEFLTGAENLLHIAKPLEFMWPVHTLRSALTFSRPRKLDDLIDHAEADTRNMGLVSLFSRLGRAAAIVDRTGAVATMNHDAENLLQSGQFNMSEGKIRPLIFADAQRFDRMMEAVSLGGSNVISDQMLLETDAELGLVVQVVALDEEVAGTDKMLVLLDDPSAASDARAEPVLRLFGLSDAEARMAAVMGSGISPAQAAETLDLSVNTIRSALKIIYNKLGIGRQGELVKIVTRLEARQMSAE